MKSKRKLLAVAVSSFPLWQVLSAAAQEIPAPTLEPAQLEEVVVTARLKSGVQDVFLERLDHQAVTDLMDAEWIGRIGDSTVATALRRVPGVSLVEDKFVYVRGLGERYATTLLNGAVVPSPDLTRNVLPLDIFPTSIVQSLAVQKSYSVDLPAHFAGGLVDVRTRGIPEGPLFSLELGVSQNEATSGKGLTYEGGGDDWLGHDDGERALSPRVRAALDAFQGDIGVANLYEFLRRRDLGASLEDARALNREIALAFKRDLGFEEKRYPNFDGQLTLGHRKLFDSGLEIGLLGGASYDHQFDTRESIEREYSNPEEVFGVRTRSTRTVDLTGNLGLGARFGDEQRLELTSLWLRNTEDQASLRDFFTDNRNFSDGQGWRHYGIRYEERELWVNQVHGRHQWGPESRHLLDSWLPASALDEALPWLDGLRFEWYLSDSRVDNQLPGETGVTALTENDPVSGAVRSSSVQLAQSMVNYRFTDLEDQVDSRGWKLSWPFLAGDFRGELAGGWDYVRKDRQYGQLDFQLGTTDPDAAEIAHLPLDELLADERILDPRYGFAVIASPTTARSYLAALTNEAWFAQVDVTWRDRWRLVVGARREQYIQATVPYAPLEYRGPKTSTDPEVLARGVFADDDWYPAVSLVYLGQDFWAETFQLRLGYSETAVRPDLREVSDASFRDPVTDHLVFGNPDVVPSRVKNYDLRAEWFFDSGDSFTASLFYKEIEDPIEFFQVPAGEAVFASRIVNADSAELAGVEIEWLWNLGRLHTWLDPFFFAGNLTLLDHELVAGAAADAPTSPKRGLAGASDYVANVQLGFDSPDGRHAATLVYNVFDKRLYIAGRLGTPDTYEEPFHSLDLNYFFYWGEHLILNAKLRNLLDDSVTLRQGGVEVYDEERGIEGVLSLQWRL